MRYDEEAMMKLRIYRKQQEKLDDLREWAEKEHPKLFEWITMELDLKENRSARMVR